MIARICLFIALAVPLMAGSTAAQSPRYAAIVVESGSGRVLHAENADALVHPASLTKMMTLYMLFEAIEHGRLSFSSRLWISEHAASQAPTKLGLRPGDTISVEDAALGLITKSANDAAVAIAENLGGSHDRFAQMMTQRARRLGMYKSHFENANGLPDPDQITTARDMATLGRALIRDFPTYYPMFSTRAFSYRGQTHGNHNKLLFGYAGTDGIKTGFTRASGYNLVASAKRGDTRLIGVVMGGMSGAWRDHRMMTLLDAGFRHGGDDVFVIAGNSRHDSTQVQPVVNRSGGGRSSWAIQVGAFPSDNAARAHASAAKKVARLSHGAVEVSRGGKPRKKLFRARIGGLSEAQAREACRTLESRRQRCQALPPSHNAG